MAGSDSDVIDWENLTNKELHDKFAQLVTEHVQELDTRFGEAMDKIDGFEKTFNTKLDTKFNELLARLPPPPAAQRQPGTVGRARRVLIDQGENSAAAPTVTAAAAPAFATEEQFEDYTDAEESEDEGAQDRPYRHPAGRQHAHRRNGRPAPRPQVRDADYVPKLKLKLQPFEGKYNPDAYLTWELETEQRFTCLNYPDERRVTAAICEFTGFASIWWSEHCRLYHDNIPTTWAALKTVMRTRWVPPYYQRELLQRLQRLRQGKNSVEEYYQELQTGLIRCGLTEDNEAMCRARGTRGPLDPGSVVLGQVSPGRPVVSPPGTREAPCRASLPGTSPSGEELPG